MVFKVPLIGGLWGPFNLWGPFRPEPCQPKEGSGTGQVPRCCAGDKLSQQGCEAANPFPGRPRRIFMTKTSQGAPAWGREGADVGLKAAGSTAPRPLTSSSSVPKVASASLPSSPTEQGCFSRLSGSRNAVRSWAAPGKGSGRAAAAFPQPSRGAHSYWRSVPCLQAGLPGTDSHGISSFPDPHGPAGAGGLQRNQDLREERTESIQQILS